MKDLFVRAVAVTMGFALAHFGFQLVIGGHRWGDAAVTTLDQFVAVLIYAGVSALAMRRAKREDSPK
jgi:hypothetical protein